MKPYHFIPPWSCGLPYRSGPRGVMRELRWGVAYGLRPRRMRVLRFLQEVAGEIPLSEPILVRDVRRRKKHKFTHRRLPFWKL